MNKDKVKQNISTGLQLHVKWVRVMLIVSIIAVIAIFFYPVKKIVQTKRFEIVSVPIDSTIVGRVGGTYTSDSLQPSPVGKSMEEPVEMSSRSIASEPIQIQIVQPKEPFDWKGTITWAIGAINGMVLVILNFKSLRKRP